jgi:predicted phage-related endonuclease
VNFSIIDVPQRSDEWHRARLGRLTSSRAADLMAKIQKGEAAARRDLRVQLVVERLTGQSQDGGYQSPEMARGVEKEPEALIAYEAATGQLIQRTGFLAHNDLMIGCSLDGHVGDFVGLVECKVPKSATHLRCLRANTVPSDYLYQIAHQLLITGAAWCDFISYDDRFPAPLQLFIKRVYASEVDLAAYELAVTLFLSEVAKEVEAVQALAAGVAA